ncbi:molecular chaperone [Pseudomonas denitrificans (nom. rej.)]|nr:molecular chaperone [Pseudomonas denitrificans (nom. rej.)]
MNAKPVIRSCQLLALFLFSSACLAGIQVGATRVIFPASDREASVLVRNEGSQDIMIQSWVEAEPGRSESDVPFAITPSLSRLGYKKQQILRIFYQGKGLPVNRESVFWLSVQEIPQVSTQDNNLQVAVRQRLKLFYRPAELVGKSEDAVKNLNWSLKKGVEGVTLQARNDSAFHVSFGKVKLLVNQKEYPVEVEMVAPGSVGVFKAKAPMESLSGDARLQWESINDYGALVKHDTALKF